VHLRKLNLEFFLQVTPEEHKGWIQEVPTTLKGKYRIVDQQSAQNARNLLEIAASLPAEAWKHCWWKAVKGAGLSSSSCDERDRLPIHSDNLSCGKKKLLV
jgi:hypothetical protein